MVVRLVNKWQLEEAYDERKGVGHDEVADEDALRGETKTTGGGVVGKVARLDVGGGKCEQLVVECLSEGDEELMEVDALRGAETGHHCLVVVLDVSENLLVFDVPSGFVHLGVPTALAAIERMGSCSEAKVGRLVPIAAVVARMVAWLAEIGYLVVLVTRLKEKGAKGFVHE